MTTICSHEVKSADAVSSDPKAATAMGTSAIRHVVAFANDHLKRLRHRPATVRGRRAGTSAALDEGGAGLPQKTWICECEISGRAHLSSLAPVGAATSTRALIRLHGQPLGYLESPVDDPEALSDHLQRSARVQFAGEIDAHLSREGATPAADGTLLSAAPTCPERTAPNGDLVSVVVCTRNRASSLEACLSAILRSDHTRLELVIVDNAPSDDSTRSVVERLAAHDHRVRYAREDRPGLSHARNRGLAVATARHIAYTDDDVLVDRHWLSALEHGFGQGQQVGCVTGLVATATIASAAETYFDARAASWSSRFTPELFDLAEHASSDPLYPYSAGVFGTGANIAVDRELLASLGGFDPVLGAGARTRGGEDLDMFVRVLRAGSAIAYVPSALVWHHHRADDAALRRQMYGYGTGLSAFVTKLLLDRETRFGVLRRVPRGLWRLARIKRTTRERVTTPHEVPARALLWEFLGFATGPFLYLVARRDQRSR